LYPGADGDAKEITISDAISLVGMTRSHPKGGGLWDDQRITAALETLRDSPQFENKAYLVVRRGRNLKPQAGTADRLRSYFGGSRRGQQGDAVRAVPGYPTLFMFRLSTTLA
jgi:hypothetical protein